MRSRAEVPGHGAGRGCSERAAPFPAWSACLVASGRSTPATCSPEDPERPLPHRPPGSRAGLGAGRSFPPHCLGLASNGVALEAAPPPAAPRLGPAGGISRTSPSSACPAGAQEDTWGEQSLSSVATGVSPPRLRGEQPATDPFLVQAAAAQKGRSSPEPQAEDAAGCAEGGSGREEKPPRLEASLGFRGAPWKQIRAEGLSCDYLVLFGRSEADGIFQELEKEVEYSEGAKLRVFGKWHNIPRKQVTYGDAGLTYTYSGTTFAPKPWIPVLDRIRGRVQLATGHTFNFVLINRYKDGHDHMGEHRDDERELVPHSPIASVSFGACRDFVFWHGASRGKAASRHLSPIRLQLEHGSLLMMNYPTNRYWYHSLPSRKKVLAPRINLTFRKVMAL